MDIDSALQDSGDVPPDGSSSKSHDDKEYACKDEEGEETLVIHPPSQSSQLRYKSELCFVDSELVGLDPIGGYGVGCVDSELDCRGRKRCGRGKVLMPLFGSGRRGREGHGVQERDVEGFGLAGQAGEVGW